MVMVSGIGMKSVRLYLMFAYAKLILIASQYQA